jgi:SAM-dependent methyltransferase
MGRQIAQTMHFEGAPWLIRDNREREERCSLMLANLGVKPGMTVCDMGCGNGFYSLQLARLVGPTGRVLAVDIQPEMLKMLEEREAAAKIDNVDTILGTLHDPKLPEGAVDLILLVDVYHEFSHPEHMLAAMRRALKPDGLIALVEYRAEDPSVPIKPLHKMSKRQILNEFPANGFKLVKEFDRLPCTPFRASFPGSAWERPGLAGSAGRMRGGASRAVSCEAEPRNQSPGCGRGFASW